MNKFYGLGLVLLSVQFASRDSSQVLPVSKCLYGGHIFQYIKLVCIFPNMAQKIGTVCNLPKFPKCAENFTPETSLIATLKFAQHLHLGKHRVVHIAW